MNLKIAVNKEIKLLSLSFFFTFLGFSGVLQYITPFFSNIGLVDLGFNCLVLIYLFFILANPVSALFVSKYGAKKCMLASSLVYSLFNVFLLTKDVSLVYFGSILLGIAASFLWTGQNSYLIRASGEEGFGGNSGFFNCLNSLGNAIGALIMGFIISFLSFKTSFLIFSLFPIIGFLLLIKIKDIKSKNGTGKINRFRLIGKAITSKTALKLSSLWFAINFVFGLIIGIIPLEIEKTLGLSYVGILSSLFFLLPILLSYRLGKFSEKKGRKNVTVFSYLLLMSGLIFLSFSSNYICLILGIILLSLNWTITKPITFALVGDVSTEDNLEFLTALFWMIQNTGVLIALLLSQIFKLETFTLYLISTAIALISLVILFPLLRLGTEKIREKISQEVR